MNNKYRQAISLISMLSVMIAFFVPSVIAIAATVTDTKVADYVSTWHLNRTSGV